MNWGKPLLPTKEAPQSLVWKYSSQLPNPFCPPVEIPFENTGQESWEGKVRATERGCRAPPARSSSPSVHSRRAEKSEVNTGAKALKKKGLGGLRAPSYG